MARRIAVVCEKLGHKMPVICTPEELMGALASCGKTRLVAEIHRAREKLAAECNYDIKAFFAGLHKRQASLGDKLVSPKKRADPTAEADRGCPSGPPAATSSEAAPAA
jgi:hypothetical protein